MSKPFDTTIRQLIEPGPAAWLEFLRTRVPDRAWVNVIDSNLATILAEADRVVFVEGPAPWIEHLEFQASRDPRLHDRAHLYSTLLEHHHHVPVRTTVILLRPAADGPELTGRREQKLPEGDVTIRSGIMFSEFGNSPSSLSSRRACPCFHWRLCRTSTWFAFARC
jgi:hypothetical protein